MGPRPSRATAPARCRRPRCGARQRSPRATAATPLAIGRRAWALWPGLGVAVLPSIATPAASMAAPDVRLGLFRRSGRRFRSLAGHVHADRPQGRRIDATVHELRCLGSASSNTTCPDSERPTGSPTSTTTSRARASASVRHGFATANETCWGSPSRFALPRNAAAAEQQTPELITQSPWRDARAPSGLPLAGDKQHRGAKRATLSQRTRSIRALRSLLSGRLPSLRAPA
jgi:hypothetical protein